MNFTITSTRALTDTVYEMELTGDTSGITKTGQFVQIALPGFYLRRPISVCDWTEGSLTIVFKVVGQGTQALAELPNGATLDLLTGLGNGYDLSQAGDKPLLIGGGVGIPPLYALCKALINQGAAPTVILGFNTEKEIFLFDKFQALGVKTHLTTVDGSRDIKGFVTDAMKDIDYTYFYTCGPESMLKAVYLMAKTQGEFSFEERMACGFGACMGCSCQTKYGSKRICKDGPVLKKEEIIW